MAVFYVAVALIGALVGTVEIFQRYRAEPFLAVRNPWGGMYLLLNAAVAVLAFHVAVLAQDLSTDTPQLTLLQWSGVAGFGAAALLRSKLLNLQLDDGRDVALGPEIVVQTFLRVIDRELDRARGKARFATVRRLMVDIDFEKAKLRLPLQLFQAMQGITEVETEQLMDRIGQVDAMTTLDGQDKAYLLGYYLLDLVGEEFLVEILDRYGADYRADQSSAENDPGAPP